MIRDRVKGTRDLLMVINMKDNILIINLTDKVCIHGLMENYIKDNG
jgi:hypothetical protein